jgi:hypothetical protein
VLFYTAFYGHRLRCGDRVPRQARRRQYESCRSR